MVIRDYEAGWEGEDLTMYWVQYILYHLRIPLESNYIDEDIMHHVCWVMVE